MEQLSSEPSRQRNNSSKFIISTEFWGMHTRHLPALSSIAPPEPNFVTLHDNSNDPTFPYGFGAKQPIVPPSLNDLNLPPNPFILVATMAVFEANPTQPDDNYSPRSPEPSEPSPISTPPMNLSTIDGWENPHTTTDENTFDSEDEPRRVHWISTLDEIFLSEGEPRRFYLPPSSSPPSPPRKMKKKLK